jgi:hypothetical protein
MNADRQPYMGPHATSHMSLGGLQGRIQSGTQVPFIRRHVGWGGQRQGGKRCNLTVRKLEISQKRKPIVVDMTLARAMEIQPR